MSDARAEAVWAAVYVEVLSARGGPHTLPEDLAIDSVAECLADPTSQRMRIAITAADAAVAQLRRELD